MLISHLTTPPSVGFVHGSRKPMFLGLLLLYLLHCSISRDLDVVVVGSVISHSQPSRYISIECFNLVYVSIYKDIFIYRNAIILSSTYIFKIVLEHEISMVVPTYSHECGTDTCNRESFRLP
ncbi:hypothetical protein GGS24DRAFT_471499 [Hypoxylon argillaceum]|nr:hypothetical protein GGS24DRAFT_471499 [Hypoxylon argillaceum]